MGNEKQIFYRNIYSILPSFIKITIKNIYNKYRLYMSFIYDLRNFKKYSGLYRKNTKNILEAKIIANYHKIEKGLSLREPRTKFGLKVINILKEDLYKYSIKYGVDKTIRCAISSLEEYIKFNNINGCNISGVVKWVEIFKKDFKIKKSDLDEGGTNTILRKDIHKKSKINLVEFFNSRHSIKNFDDNEKIEMKLIEKAVEMAKKTPSVCNRQAARLFVITDKVIRNKILSLQNGNSGFGSQPDKILIIGINLNYFLSVGERNQGWIDGGLFSMSLIYALHSLGLATCCLNWSVDSIVDKKLKKVTGLSKNISVIMLLAVGHLPKKIKVAKSDRKELIEILKII